MLKKYDYLDKVVLGVMDENVIKDIKTFSNKLKVLAFMPSVEDISAYAKAGADYVRLWEPWVTRETVDEVRKYPVELWIMTGKLTHLDSDVGVTDEEGLKTLFDYGVDGILINDIDVLQEYIAKRK